MCVKYKNKSYTFNSFFCVVVSLQEGKFLHEHYADLVLVVVVTVAVLEGKRADLSCRRTSAEARPPALTRWTRRSRRCSEVIA